MSIGLALGGGAPNLPLMTGALLALDEAGIRFRVITTTGAGMVVGLLYAAPRKPSPDADWVTTRREALRATREWGIDDLIYKRFPVNYKIFQKPGTLAEGYARATNPALWSIPRKTRRQRLLGDTLAFWSAAMSPSSLTHRSRGLCQPPPWIELLVDFDELERNLAPEDIKFRLSAYCIDDQMEETFHRDEISVEHFNAALAMPFIYEPYHIVDPHDGRRKAYLEGSAFRTLQLNPENVMAENEIDTIIYFDVMGNRNLISEPRWLIDAWGKSIIAPLTRLAEQSLEIFKLERERNHLCHEVAVLKAQIERLKAGHRAEDIDDPDLVADDAVTHERRAAWKPSEGDDEHNHSAFDRTEVLRMNFADHIPEEHWPFVLDWSYSNMSTLFDCGMEAGRAFVERHGERLRASMARGAGAALEAAE